MSNKKIVARNLSCFWAVRELGMRRTQLARVLRISQRAVSMAVGRDEELAKDHNSSILFSQDLAPQIRIFFWNNPIISSIIASVIYGGLFQSSLPAFPMFLRISGTSRSRNSPGVNILNGTLGVILIFSKCCLSPVTRK